MAPCPPAVGGLLKQVIYYHLDKASYENALFFAERFTAQDSKSSDSPFLYALCHLRLGDYRSAYDASKALGYRGTHLGCSWVFAQASLALERHKDGITALDKSRGQWSQKTSIGKHSATTRAMLPDASTVLCLMGKLYRGYDDKKKAVACFEEALKLNAFMWDAFTALCEMGVSMRVPNIFRPSEALLQSFEVDTNHSGDLHDASLSTSLEIPSKRSMRNIPPDLGGDPFGSNTPTMTDVTNGDSHGEGGENDFIAKMHTARVRLAASTNPNAGSDGMETPTGPPLADANSFRNNHSHDPPQAPSRRTRAAQAIDYGNEPPPPPRMNNRAGIKRTTKTQDKGQEHAHESTMTEAPNASTGNLRGTIPPAERKRTVSGHPVPRSTNVEEPATRRSARLSTYHPPSKANSGTGTISASTGRELKKARPPITRILRPGSSGASVGRVVSGNRKPLEDPHTDMDHGELSRSKDFSSQSASQRSIEADAVRFEEALKWLLDLMKKFGNGYYSLTQYQCHEALQALNSLPPSHRGTLWVLAQTGRAHYEQASYAEAEKFFKKMREQAPSRLEDMEVYSTILWHLRKEAELSFLAHELVDTAWHSPQAWCALGNAWSLARDHEQALKCFKRATQLDPKFAYAFTLQGHEHVTNEEYDKALTAYRHAISADRRHYNAYYGIGRVQERLGDYEKAYTHFHAAQSINPNNAVLICCIGTVLEKQKQIMPALQAYSKAAELAPRAAQTRYKKARALLAVGQLEAAQKELMVLKDLAPEEATVHFLLGKLYRNMGEKQLAVRYFTCALALDPKASQQIKEAIESLEDDIPMDDSMIA